MGVSLFKKPVATGPLLLNTASLTGAVCSLLVGSIFGRRLISTSSAMVEVSLGYRLPSDFASDIFRRYAIPRYTRYSRFVLDSALLHSHLRHNSDSQRRSYCWSSDCCSLTCLSRYRKFGSSVSEFAFVITFLRAC